MSDDLISKNAVLQLIDEFGYVNCRDRKDYESNSRVDKIRQRIVELPIAYDADKVADQITRATRPGAPEYYLDGRPVIYKEQAIEFVRSGGRQQS